jgi:hypothetical protein
VRDDRNLWAAVAAARLPAVGLTALAPLRCRSGVTITRVVDFAWVTFQSGDPDVIRGLMPVAGIEFFVRRGAAWARFGHRLPTADAPPNGGVSFDQTIFPAPVTPSAAPDAIAPPLRPIVVRGGPPRPVTAMTCHMGVLSRWADSAPAANLAAVRAARCDDRVMLLGERLPPIAGERFWGARVLVPVGFRPEPDLPPDVLRAACAVAADELLVLDATGADAIPDAAFEPLTRAGIRLAGAVNGQEGVPVR